MLPHTATIYNKYVEAGVEKWKRTVLEGVFWDGIKGSVIRKTGVASADGLVLLIPRDVTVTGSYLKPKAWAALTNKDGHWTIQSGDTVVLGALTFEPVKSAAELKQFDDVFNVTNADPRDYGDDLAHWEVTGR